MEFVDNFGVLARRKPSEKGAGRTISVGCQDINLFPRLSVLFRALSKVFGDIFVNTLIKVAKYGFMQ